MTMTEKLCFVIGPIGSAGEPRRIAADWLLQGIIKPTLEAAEFGYTVKRADQIAEPGLISDQVITMAIEAPLVVADMTDHNANAFYELGIRHMARKPVIHMIRADQLIPFDNADYRAIKFSILQFDDLEKAKADLAEQVRAIQREGYEVANPVIRAMAQQKLAQSDDPRDAVIKSLSDSMTGLQREVEQLRSYIAMRVDAEDTASKIRRKLQETFSTVTSPTGDYFVVSTGSTRGDPILFPAAMRGHAEQLPPIKVDVGTKDEKQTSDKSKED